MNQCLQWQMNPHPSGGNLSHDLGTSTFGECTETEQDASTCLYLAKQGSKVTGFEFPLFYLFLTSTEGMHLIKEQNCAYIHAGNMNEVGDVMNHTKFPEYSRLHQQGFIED